MAGCLARGHNGPVDQAGEMPAASPGLAAVAEDRHEWHRMAVGWHVAFGFFAAMVGGLILADVGLSPVRRSAALAILAAACVWYAVAGRRVVGSEFSRAGLAYVTVAIPLTVGLYAAVPFGGLLLCMLYPHIWAMLPVRRAVAASAATTVAIAAASLSWTDVTTGQLLSVGSVAVASLIVAPLIGLWIGRIIRQSKSRAALIAELAVTRAELADFSRRAGAAAERERLARDIHDTLTQGFASILLLLEAAEAEIGPGRGRALTHLQNARKTARENIAEARAMITELSPPHLRSASLPGALGQLVDGAGAEMGLQARLTVTGQPRPLAARAEVVLLRASQEALANVRKHAGAAAVDVSLAYQHDAVTLQVTDDGRGFDPGQRSSGFGLDGMRARVTQVGGTLIVRTVPGAGTTIRVDLPLTAGGPLEALAGVAAPGPAPGDRVGQ
jgi:signal transduction histidine kinase